MEYIKDYYGQIITARVLLHLPMFSNLLPIKLLTLRLPHLMWVTFMMMVFSSAFPDADIVGYRCGVFDGSMIVGFYFGQDELVGF